MLKNQAGEWSLSPGLTVGGVFLDAIVSPCNWCFGWASGWGDNFRFAIYKRLLATSTLSDLSAMSALSVGLVGGGLIHAQMTKNDKCPC